MRVLTLAGAALLLSAPVFAQDEIARRKAVEVMARVPFEKAMKGAPYSAEVVIESSQALPDGNRISRKTTGSVHRDSEGRTRREEDVNVRTATPNGFVSSVRKTISIVDPVAGVSYSLDPERKIAWKTTMGGGDPLRGKIEESITAVRNKLEVEKMAAAQKPSGEEETRTASPTPAAGGGGRGGGGARVGGAGAGGGTMVARGGGGGMRGVATMPDTPLEHKTIEGVAVEGRKTTTVIPAGQIGNEQPITITSEEWRSPELGLLVLTRHSDPRSGESIYKLQNIIRAEPDQSLFVVPADYTVRETGIRRMIEEAARKF